MSDLQTELTYKPTLRQRLSRVILGTLLVPLFGDMCVLIYFLSQGEFETRHLHPVFLMLTYIIAIIFTGIPALLLRLSLEFSTQKLGERLVYAFIFAIGLGVFLNAIWKTENTNEYAMWIVSSIIAVIITELLLYQHIKRCIKKQNQESFRQPENNLGD